MSKPKSFKTLVGRTIVRVESNASWDGIHAGWIYRPCIYFDDGSVLKLATQETDLGSEYGTALLHIKNGRIQ